MADDPLPEPDRLPGAPHPRDTLRLYGQGAAEAEVLAAHAGGRMHHAWMLTGPRGIGKATLAWRIARFLLTAPLPGEEGGGLFGAPPPPEAWTWPRITPSRAVCARWRNRAPSLRRTANDRGNALSQFITVDEVRKMKSFFALSAADGGRRVAIIDSVDEMNTSAANALLKLLEEPPAGVVFLVISHQPARLLPTIRSRCRDLRLAPLAPGDLAAALAQAGGPVEEGMAAGLAELAGGSVGEAFRLAHLDGLAIYRGLVELLASLPRLDRARAHALAEAAAGRGAEEVFDLTLTLIDLALARLARTAARGAPLPEAVPGGGADGAAGPRALGGAALGGPCADAGPAGAARAGGQP